MAHRTMSGVGSRRYRKKILYENDHPIKLGHPAKLGVKVFLSYVFHMHFFALRGDPFQHAHVWRTA